MFDRYKQYKTTVRYMCPLENSVLSLCVLGNAWGGMEKLVETFQSATAIARALHLVALLSVLNSVTTKLSLQMYLCYVECS